MARRYAESRTRSTVTRRAGGLSAWVFALQCRKVTNRRFAHLTLRQRTPPVWRLGVRAGARSNGAFDGDMEGDDSSSTAWPQRKGPR